MKQTLLLTLFLPAILLAAGAQAQPELRNQLQQCAEVDNVLERLACYDELSSDDAATPQQSVPAASPPVVNRPQSSTPARTVTETVPTQGSTQTAESDEPAAEDDISSFGQAPEQARVETLEDGEKALVDTVTAIKPLDSTRVLITLASGQVWRQTVGKRYMLREGDIVRITTSGWGKDYRLSADGKRGYIQVSRSR